MSISPIPGRTTAPIPSTTMLGYQAQGAATNVCLQSNAFTTAPWVAYGTPSATQNVVGPNGQANYSWTLTDNAAGAVEGILQDITITAASWTVSLKVKKTTGATSFPLVLWYVVAGSAQMAGVTIDTNNGVATNWSAYTGFTMASGTAARIRSYSADYWLVELTKTGTAAAHRVDFYPAGTANATQSTGAADATAQGSAVICDFQVEAAAAATSYIPTTTVAVTRNADVLTYTGGDIPNLKTLMAGFRREVGVSALGIVATLGDNTTTSYESFYLTSATASLFQGLASTVQQWAQTPAAYTPGTSAKSAWSAATNDVKAALNGAGQTQDTSASIPTISQLDVGHIAGVNQLNGNVGPIYGWTRNLSQSELNAVTA